MHLLSGCPASAGGPDESIEIVCSDCLTTRSRSGQESD